MKEIEVTFQTNANSTGIQEFERMKRDVNSQNKPVYIYKRTIPKGRIFGYETFIPTTKKAGTYPLPNNKTITYTEDFEEYPGSAKFGMSAFFCTTYEAALHRFEELMKKGELVVAVKEVIESTPNDAPKGHRGRPKANRPDLLFPAGDFSCQELATFNNIQYPVAFIFLKEEEAKGTVKFVKEERRNVKGKPTRLFSKTS